MTSRENPFLALAILSHDINTMYSKDYPYQKPVKTVIRMDPDCAICRAPASMACDCEAKGLDQAVRQAEARMMQNMYNEIRNWVRAHAQDYILEYFRLLTDRRKVAHAAHMDRIYHHAAHYYGQPPHPSEIAAADAQMKRGVDEDWQASVQRYPEVLEYFYSLVYLQLPDENEAAVKDPPLSALNGPKRERVARRGIAPAPTVASGRSVHERERDSLPPRRTPPPIEQRRTPAPRDRRRTSVYQPPPPTASYYPSRYQ